MTLKFRTVIREQINPDGGRDQSQTRFVTPQSNIEKVRQGI